MTKEFSLGQSILDNLAKARVIRKAVEQSRLPEETAVIGSGDIEGWDSEGGGPMIVVTEYPRVDEALRSYRKGASRYIRMTFSEEELLKKFNE